MMYLSPRDVLPRQIARRFPQTEYCHVANKHSPYRRLVAERSACTIARCSNGPPSVPSNAIHELLVKRASVSVDDAHRVVMLCPEVRAASSERASVVIELLLSLGLHGQDIGKICVKHPWVLVSAPERMADVLLFLREDLKLEGKELTDLLVRFPHVLSYDVKAHLRPHMAYLGSLGEEDLAGLVRQRPAVLGEGIESVIKFLQQCRMPRRQIYRMLRSYPLDYCLKLKAPCAVAEITAQGKDRPGDAPAAE